MPRVLFITVMSPLPPTDGGRRLTLDLLRTYALYTDLDLLTFYDQTESEVPSLLEKQMSQVCRRIAALSIGIMFGKHRFRQLVQFVQSSFSPWPFRLLKFWHPQMAKLCGEWLANENYDIVHFDYISSTRYLPLAHDYPAKKICTEHNVEWETFIRFAENTRNPLVRLFIRREATRLKAYELSTLRKMDAVIALSKRDEAVLRHEGVTQPIHIFRRPMEIPPAPITTFEQAEPSVISLGRLDYTREHGTLWCYHNVWPLVLKRLPNARWHIFGEDPTPAIRNLHNGQNVFVEGFVEDLTPFLKRSRACIIPIHIGAGIRIKILDMLSLGLPCVSTRMGAQGLENDGVWIADGPEAFAEGIVRLISEPELWYQMSQAGRQFLIKNYSPERATEEFAAFLHRTLSFSINSNGS